MGALSPILTPHGRLLLAESDDAPALPPELSQRLQEAFARGSGHGLLQLGAGEVGTALPPVFGYWRELGTRYVTAVCTLPDVDDGRALAPIPPLPTQALDSLTSSAPPMTGAEYLTALCSTRCGTRSTRRSAPELSESRDVGPGVPQAQEPGVEPGRPRPLQSRREPEGRRGAVRVSGDLHDAAVGAREGPAPAARPGAAASTRARRTSRGSCRCSAGAARRGAMRLAEGDGRCGRDLSSAALDAGRGLSASDGPPALEAAGVIVRVPGTWRANRPPRPQVTATVGGKPPSGLGTEALLDFQMEVTLDGERLTAAEIAQLLAGSDGFTSSAGAGSRSIARSSRGCSTSFERSSRRRRPARPQRSPRRCACSPARTSRATASSIAAAPDWSRDRRRPLARRDARGAPPPRRARARRSGRRAQGDAAAVPAGRRALAAPPVDARPRRLPGRRHGPGQDDAGAGAAAGAASGKAGGEQADRACSSRRRRCSPTGRRRSSASRRA